jgi:glycosyltransferase involved in cell wall biosynthesis
MIRISVVIPTWQRPGLLQKCLAALANQTLSADEYEIIVVSDGPDEVTANGLETWVANSPAQHRFLPMPQKKGPAAARNYGWQHARAPFIAFTDDDTLPDTNWLSAYLQVWNGNDLAAFTGKVIVPLEPRPTDFARNTAGLETADFVTANCACTRPALQLTGGFDERFAMAWREDSDLHFKLLQHHITLSKNEAAVVVHPVREARWGVSIREQKKTMYNALLYQKFPQLYAQYDNARPPLLYYGIIVCALVFVIGLIIHQPVLALLFGLGWLSLTLWFALKRLRNNSHSLSHITEMLYTSAVIPWLSVYWHFYGLMKYNTWFV